MSRMLENLTRADASTASCLVSIVIPAYNAAAYVADAIRSGLSQSFEAVEIIVVDDCSIDTTAAVVKSFDDPRVRLARTDRNGGPSAARNRGIDLARGDWIALLDADDLYDPERIARLVELAARSGADIVADNLLVCPTVRAADAYPLIPHDKLADARAMTAAEFVAGNTGNSGERAECYGYLQPMLSRAFLNRYRLRYDETIRFGEDYLLYNECFRRGARWWLTPETLYSYQLRPGSAASAQASGDLRRIADADGEMLGFARSCADRALVAALRRHKAKVDRLYHYRAFTDAVKSSRPANALEFIAANPQGIIPILREASKQLPTILRKAIDGGYLRLPRPVAPECAH